METKLLFTKVQDIAMATLDMLMIVMAVLFVSVVLIISHLWAVGSGFVARCFSSLDNKN